MMMKQGIFKGGWSQNHPNQEKKHTSQMTKEEKEYLVDKVRDVRNVTIHPHLQWKRDSGQITFDILNMTRMFRAKNLSYHIKEFSTIKLDDGRVDHRVLIRSNRTERVAIEGQGMRKCNLMFVLSLDTKEIVTEYFVEIYNHFENVNMERYDETLDIIGCLESEYRRYQNRFGYEPKEDELIDGLTVDEWLNMYKG